MIRRTPGIGSSTVSGARSRFLSKGMSSLIACSGWPVPVAGVPFCGTGLALIPTHLHPSDGAMAYVLRALIPVVWIVWLLYWILAARATNETERRENFRSRMTH